MAVRDIVEIPDERLRVKYSRVESISAVHNLIDDMLDTLYATDNGIGLAAPQIGYKEAVLIIDISEQRNQPLILVNPVIVAAEGRIKSEEGCLSVPGVYAQVDRYKKVRVRALDREGFEIFVEDEDYLSIVMQHEIDHLHGKIFIDYLSPLKYQRAVKKLQKNRKLTK